MVGALRSCRDGIEAIRGNLRHRNKQSLKPDQYIRQQINLLDLATPYKRSEI